MGDSVQLSVQTPHEVRILSADRFANGPLSDVLRQAELPLNTRCGQRGLCDGCLIEILQGSLLDRAGQPLLADPQRPVRACQCRVPPVGTVSIRIPARSLLAHAPQVATSFRVGVSQAHNPLWQCLELPEHDFASDARLIRAIRLAIAWRADRDVPLRMEGSFTEWAHLAGFPRRVVLDHRGDHWSVRPAPREMADPPLGLAIDAGTTTVVVLLVNLEDGRVLQTASAWNQQTRLGDNVLTRINLCLQNPQMVSRLQQWIIRRNLRPLFDQVLRAAGAASEQVRCVAVAGNTTMLHLLAGVDPGPLGTAPFEAAFLEHRVLEGADVAIGPGAGAATGKRRTGSREGALLPQPAFHLLPGAAAYVGADVIAGLAATGMMYRDPPCLLVDLGTNGEIVLQHQGRARSCATAAGPAFEGAGLRNGMRAAAGAISHIRLQTLGDEPELEIIGKRPPIGICGTAYVDFLTAGRRCGLIGPHGRFLPGEGEVPRLVTRSTTRGFDVATTEDGQVLQITEADMARLLQAKAAVAAGIVCLLQRAHLQPDDIDTVFLAGGFGFYMDRHSVVGCGLLPGFRVEQIDLAGNTALAGAYLALTDSSVLREMKRIAEDLEIIELNRDPDFESQYIDHLALPDINPPKRMETEGLE